MADEAGDQLATVWPQAVTTLTTTLTKQHGAWLSMASARRAAGQYGSAVRADGLRQGRHRAHLRDPITATLSNMLQMPVSLAVTVADPSSSCGATPTPT